MKNLSSFYLTSLWLVATASSLNAQDTIIYQGILKNTLIYESIVLYPDSTFKWTSEYDLSWSEYGRFNLTNKALTLRYYNYFTPEEFTEQKYLPETPSKVERFEVDGKKLYRLKKNGTRIKRRRDQSLRRKWGWLLGYRYKYEIISINQ